MKVLFLAAEAAPLAKVGGLADVAGELPRALGRLGCEVRVVMPFHASIDRASYPIEPRCELDVPRSGGGLRAELYALDLEGVHFWLIDGPPVRQVPGVYGNSEQDGAKFVFCDRAALLACEQLSWQPDLLHANDWHAAAAVNFLRAWRQDGGFWSDVRSLFTIHNLAYMGSEAARADYAVPEFELPDVPDWARHLPLPSGIASADWISTVSPAYAREIQTAEYGFGLEHLLSRRSASLTGIMNGIDPQRWDPAHDAALVRAYDIETLPARDENKQSLRDELGLPQDTSPLLAMVTRLDQQKGVDLALVALEMLLSEPWQFVLLGTGDPALEEQARRFAERHPQRARALLRFDEHAARRLYASGDLLLIPSRFEPCGLTQLIGMRYGSVPVVRGTGGLLDSVPDADLEAGGTGFVFQAPAAADLAGALGRALTAFRDLARWRAIQHAGMRRDSSWGKAASEYVELYRKLADA